MIKALYEMMELFEYQVDTFLVLKQFDNEQEKLKWEHEYYHVDKFYRIKREVK